LIQPLNQTQRIPTFSISGREILQSHTWYTVPAGKKAEASGIVQCTGLGAAANASFVPAGVIMFRWVNAAIVGDYLEAPRELSNANGGQFARFDVPLSAGETLITQQNSGTNAEFNMWARVQESPL